MTKQLHIDLPTFSESPCGVCVLLAFLARFLLITTLLDVYLSRLGVASFQWIQWIKVPFWPVCPPRPVDWKLQRAVGHASEHRRGLEIENGRFISECWVSKGV